jgi:nitroreductase
MNPDLNFVFQRRSVRAYQDREVDPRMVRDLLEAGMSAPSAVAKDPWHFIVVREAETKARLVDQLPNGRMLTSAPIGLVVCGDLARAHNQSLSFLLQDCSAAIENILLAAHALGLGAVWLGIHPREHRIEHVRRVLGIPEGIVPVSAIALGWPAEFPEPRTRYRDDAVHRERW